MKSRSSAKLLSSLMAIVMAIGLMLPLPAFADLPDGDAASLSDAAQGLLAAEADHGVTLEAQSTGSGKQVGVAVSGDTLDGVKIRFRPAGSYKPVSINKDGTESQNVAHLFYNGRSSQFQLKKAGDNSYYFHFYQHYKNSQPQTSGDCVLDVERTKNDESYYKEGQVIHVTEAGTATNKKWRLIPQADGTYHIQNVRSGLYMSLQDLTKTKADDNKLMQRKEPFAWEIELVSGDNETLETIKEYDSYNFTYEGKTVTSLNWMGALPETLKITDISIPGTHDSGTCSLESGQDSMSDQRYYIDELLNAGVRHLDLRTDLNGSIVRIVHSTCHCLNRDGKELTLEDTLGWINSFLEANPTETIVLQVKMDKGGSECERLTFNRLQNEAKKSGSRIWAGNHVPTLKEVRGQIVVISRLDPASFPSDSFTITRYGKEVQWALDCHNWRDSKDQATALTAQGSDYEVWTQDNWNHDASGKKPYIKAALLGNTDDAYTNSTLARYEQAKMVGKDAWIFNYTSCTDSSAPFHNSKAIHQWLYDRSNYDNSERLVCSDTFTGIMAFDFADELMAKHIYRTNFNRHYITIHGINMGGAEIGDPLTIYVGENENASAHFTREATMPLIKAHFNVESYIVGTAPNGAFLTEDKVTNKNELDSATATCATNIQNGNVPDNLYVFLEAPEKCAAEQHDWDDGTVTTQPTCITTGIKTKACKRCGETETEVIPVDLTAHVTYTEEDATTDSATCEEGGRQTQYEICSLCNEVVKTRRIDTPALGHSWNEASYAWSDDKITATATHYCSRCGAQESETVQSTSRVRQGSDCETAGLAVYEADFENEDFGLQEMTAQIPALGHDWDEASYVWSGGNATVTAKRVCKHDAEHVQTEDARTSFTVTKAATCTAQGQAVYMASFKNEAFEKQSKTVAIPIAPNSHDWNSPSYTWSTDNGTVVATRTCKHNALHMQVEIASTTSKVTKAATATEKGQTTYTAAFKNAAFAEQSKAVANIPASGATPVTLAKAVTKGKTKLKLSWNKVTGAGRYLVYLAPCNANGKTYKFKKIKTLSAGKTSLVKGGLKANTSYRARVIAQAKSNGAWKTISKSLIAHVVTTNKKGKYTNASSLTLDKARLTLKTGKSANLSGTVSKTIEGKNMTAAVHTKLLRFTTTNKNVATVSAKGKVTAKNPGTCRIYVQTSNGLWKSCKVTVR